VTAQTSATSDYSIVALETFIQATRDSGYKGTASAVSELVDNSLQAGATKVELTVTKNDDGSAHPITLTLRDNGSGMSAATLRQALRFGGSSRFNDRGGMGRYGMGLPNSSFSQAQRVTVQTWTSPERVLTSYLDLDEIASGALKEVPPVRRVEAPEVTRGAPSGTLVTWSRCDRLDNRRISTVARKLLAALGRKFRHHLWRGVCVSLNGEQVAPVDPLFLHEDSIFSGAKQFGSDSVYEVAADAGDPTKTGLVRVRFSQLPVAEWSQLPPKEKRLRGVSKGAGVSVVRAGREVDYGWFFLGGKRRENYDDWWRCEVLFDPILDEAFGITHTKQQVRPQPHLLEALAADMEATARALNGLARRAHNDAKVMQKLSNSEARAGALDELLTPLPEGSRSRDRRVLETLAASHGALLSPAAPDAAQLTQYRIVPQRLSETTFFNYARSSDGLVLVLNPEHPFYKQVYRPLLESELPSEVALRAQLDLLLLSAARSDALLEGDQEVERSDAFRQGWSDTLATYLNG